MLKYKFNSIYFNILRNFSKSLTKNTRVTVLGASGGVGQPLSLLLKQSHLITKLNLYDIKDVISVAEDLSHIDTECRVQGFDGPHFLKDALCGSEIVVIVAGFKRKPGMKRDDLFNENADIIKKLAENCARYCPKAWVAMVTNPVNSMVPLLSEIYIHEKIYDPKTIFGVTTLDIIRGRTFISQMKGVKPNHVKVDVIGGHSEETIIPILSRVIPHLNASVGDLLSLAERIRSAGTQIVLAKEGTGSATLSTAHAVAEFIFSLCQALQGREDVVVCTYVASCVTEAAYFSTPILLGKQGVKENYGIGKISFEEKRAVKKAIKVLKENIETAVTFVKEALGKCK